MTNNFDNRDSQHKNKIGSKFTAKYNINKLVFYQEFTRVEEAILAEKKIKGWNRKKKMGLIKTINPEFKDLTKSED